MTVADLPDSLIHAVLDVARAGADEALRYFRCSVHIDNKAGSYVYDPVTEGDRAAETVMRAQIEAKYPEHGILGEEHGEKATGSPWRWVLDPIDGTRGFVAGTPTWTTLVGLELEGVPVVGAIVQPFTGEAWHGFPGGARHHHGGATRRCQASSCRRLDEARLATTDPRPLPHGPLSEDEARRFAALATRCPVTRFGHDAYAYGLLALGTLDLVVEAGLQRYDVAALVPVLRGAGAYVAAWDGKDPYGGGTMVASASEALLREAAEALKAA